MLKIIIIVIILVNHCQTLAICYTKEDNSLNHWWRSQHLSLSIHSFFSFLEVLSCYLQKVSGKIMISSDKQRTCLQNYTCYSSFIFIKTAKWLKHHGFIIDFSTLLYCHSAAWYLCTAQKEHFECFNQIIDRKLAVFLYL